MLSFDAFKCNMFYVTFLTFSLFDIYGSSDTAIQQQQNKKQRATLARMQLVTSKWANERFKVKVNGVAQFVLYLNGFEHGYFSDNEPHVKPNRKKNQLHKKKLVVYTNPILVCNWIP